MFMHTVAAIDVGSNATRLVCAWVSPNGVLTRTEFQRYPVRLGADVFAHGVVGPTRQRALADVFVTIAAQLRERRVRAYRAVATSAMRDAKNGSALVRDIYKETGIVVEIISGVEESRLSRAALVRSLGTVQEDALILDLGGGSLELERAHRRGARSLPLGTVRLLEQFPQLKAPLTPAGLLAVRDHILQHTRRLIKTPRPTTLAIGTGGNLDTLASLLAVPGTRIPAVDLAQLDNLARAVAAMSNEERVQAYGVRPDRADLLLPAVLVIAALVQLFGLQTLVVPGTGLREALLHDLVTPAEPGQAARRLLGTSNDHAAMAMRAASLGKELFASLSCLHGLWPPALHPFLTALYAWYFGAFLHAPAALQHGLYLLAQVDNLDLAPSARQVALFALQAQRPSAAPLWPTGPEANPEDEKPARILAGLLQLTLALAPLARRTTPLEVDVLTDPVRIRADLSTALEPRAVALLADAVGRRIVVQ